MLLPCPCRCSAVMWIFWTAVRHGGDGGKGRDGTGRSNASRYIYIYIFGGHSFRKAARRREGKRQTRGIYSQCTYPAPTQPCTGLISGSVVLCRYGTRLHLS
ncbi:hypothetical protein GGR50DRAFT_406674 [Xylaria sp. CBS 124048]|nr:hypothetical protein GGR50DRAFT_406674 [Xylaria sp. CBS 124048]